MDLAAALRVSGVGSRQSAAGVREQPRSPAVHLWCGRLGCNPTHQIHCHPERAAFLGGESKDLGGGDTANIPRPDSSTRSPSSLAQNDRMSVPGTATELSTSYYDSISKLPGTGPRVRFDRPTSTRPSADRAPRGYSRPPAAVTSRHQRVAGGRVDPRHIPPGPGHNRCRRQVAPSHDPGGRVGTFNV